MPNEVPLPGHWKQNDDSIRDSRIANGDSFEDEVPLALSVPVTEPTDEEKAAQLVAQTPVPKPQLSDQPSAVAQALTQLAEAEEKTTVAESPSQTLEPGSQVPQPADQLTTQPSSAGRD